MSDRLTKPLPQRPDSINEIISTLKRYDVSVIEELQDYLQNQYDNDYSDLNSNLALLKLYELSEDNTAEREESTIKILVKGLIEFVDQDFPLYLHLLPASIFSIQNEYNTKIQNLISLYELLIANKFEEFTAKNEVFGAIVDDHCCKLIEQTYLRNKNSKFLTTKTATEEVPATKLSKVIGQLLQ